MSAVLGLLLGGLPLAAQNQLSFEQFGTNMSDLAAESAPAPFGGAFVCGSTLGTLASGGGGYVDAWLARYDSSNQLLWLRQFGSPDADYALDVIPDGAGGVFVCGNTNGDLGNPHLTNTDAWLARFDGGGNQLWIRQIGTPFKESGYAVAADGSGGVFIGGTTWGSLGGPSAGLEDNWIARYDGFGNRDWIRQYGSTGKDRLKSLVYEPAGYLLAAGTTDGDFGGVSQGGFDAWLARYNVLGNPVWIRSAGTSNDEYIENQALDGSGGTFVCGRTAGTLGAASMGGNDAWIARYDGSGALLWTQQLGGALTDEAYAIAPVATGGVYVGGTTSSSLYAPWQGGYDVWLSRFDAAGNQLWAVQFGSAEGDYVASISSTGSDELVACGSTFGNLGGGHPGFAMTDAWVARYDDTCGVGPSYCSPSATSIPGCQAAISTVGLPSLANPDQFAIHSGDIPGNNIGLCFFGANGPASIPLGTLGGLVCVQPPKFRSAPKSGGGHAGVCDGDLSFTLQDLIDSSSIIVPGALIHAAMWSRDPANPDGFLLSDGLQFTVCP